MNIIKPELIANEVAEFVRDNMDKLMEHPMDYQDHYDFIYSLFIDWHYEQFEDDA